MDIQEALSYDPETGIFTWLCRRAGKANAGSVAGCTRPSGYVDIIFQRKRYRAHRLAFLFMTGSIPCIDVEVDHIDGNTSNNAWNNLRLCTHAENSQNRKTPSHNTSGLTGAFKSKDKWYSMISVNKKKHYLGFFNTKEEAHNAYLEKKKELHTFNPIPRGIK